MTGHIEFQSSMDIYYNIHKVHAAFPFTEDGDGMVVRVEYAIIFLTQELLREGYDLSHCTWIGSSAQDAFYPDLKRGLITMEFRP